MLDEVKGLMEVYLTYNSLTATTTVATARETNFALGWTPLAKASPSRQTASTGGKLRLICGSGGSEGGSCGEVVGVKTTGQGLDNQSGRAPAERNRLSLALRLLLEILWYIVHQQKTPSPQ